MAPDHSRTGAGLLRGVQALVISSAMSEAAKGQGKDQGPAGIKAQVQRLLAEAQAHFSRRDGAACESALARALALAPERSPEQAEVLQMMAVLKKAQGRVLEAETLFRRALEMQPNLPHGHNNFALLLGGTGRRDDAIAHLAEAVRLKPNFTDAHINLGLMLAGAGRPSEAEQHYRTALSLQPNHLMAKQCLAAVLTDLDRAQEAETVARQALAQSGRDTRQAAALAYTLGRALAEQQRHGEALAALDQAKALVPEIAEADYVRGNVLQRLGRADEAMASYRAAIERNPQDLRAHRELNQLLYRQKRDQEFLSSYDEVAAQFPDVAAIALDKASFLIKQERYKEAEAAFARGAALDPANVAGFDGQGLALAGLKRFDEAIAAHEKAVRLEPQNCHAWCNFSATLMRAGDAEKAREAAAQARAIEPGNQHALALWGLSLRMLEDGREEVLNDYANHVQVFDLEPPDGFSTMAEFNAALTAELSTLHRDKREFLDQTLRGGTQTVGDLFGAGHALTERLRARIDEAVNTYIQRMKSDEAHPLTGRRGAQFAYQGSWSSRLSDCGFHTNHVHPKGWISSCYYVALPDAVRDEQEQQGWIKFGEPPFEIGLKHAIRRSVQPVPGRLVLFPSYMWHGTVPFHSGDPRLTIAFDVVPE